MKKYIISIAALIIACTVSSAQSFQEGFFLDGYTLGYRYNPAFHTEGSVLSIGEWTDNSRNNVGMATFLYPTEDGELVTALHESISPDTFLGGLKDDNYLDRSVNFNLFSYAWKKGDFHYNLEGNIRAGYSAYLPKELFQILKLGSSEKDYDLSGVKASAQAIAELAYGFSRQVNSWLTVGGRAKLLVGVESLNYQVTRFDLSLSEEQYKATVEADLDLTSVNGQYRTDENGYINFSDISYRDKWKMPSGAGVAVDLGIVATPVEGLTISLSALDLGGIIWYYGNSGHSSCVTSFEGVKALSYEKIKAGDIAGEFKEVQDQFTDNLKFRPSAIKTKLEAVPFTLYMGTKYAMPFYKALEVGLTGCYNSRGGFSYKEFRAGAAWNPSSKIGVTANIGTGDFGLVYGAALTAGIQKFHLNAGVQNGFGGTVPYTSMPLKANNKCVTVGLTYDI